MLLKYWLREADLLPVVMQLPDPLHLQEDIRELPNLLDPLLSYQQNGKTHTTYINFIQTETLHLRGKLLKIQRVLL